MPQDSIRHLPAQSPPVETGPTRFGTDKTGVFIRADNALGFSIAIQNLLQDRQQASIRLDFWKTEIENLLLLLESSYKADHADSDAVAG